MIHEKSDNQSSIFIQTEVNILDKTRQNRLPKIKLNSTVSILKASSSSMLPIEAARPKSSFSNFLKRKEYLGNMSRSNVSTALIDDIKRRVDQQFNE